MQVLMMESNASAWQSTDTVSRVFQREKSLIAKLIEPWQMFRNRGRI
jgi:hypothetical protein